MRGKSYAKKSRGSSRTERRAHGGCGLEKNKEEKNRVQGGTKKRKGEKESKPWLKGKRGRVLWKTTGGRGGFREQRWLEKQKKGSRKREKKGGKKTTSVWAMEEGTTPKTGGSQKKKMRVLPQWKKTAAVEGKRAAIHQGSGGRKRTRLEGRKSG